MQNTFAFEYSETASAGVLRTLTQRIVFEGESFLEAWSKVTAAGLCLISGTAVECLSGGRWIAWVQFAE